MCVNRKFFIWNLLKLSIKMCITFVDKLINYTYNLMSCSGKWPRNCSFNSPQLFMLTLLFDVDKKHNCCSLFCDYVSVAFVSAIFFAKKNLENNTIMVSFTPISIALYPFVLSSLDRLTTNGRTYRQTDSHIWAAKALIFMLTYFLY